ncbi:YifB family Mg chelatase-like AAA ATPase [Jannaschia sp. LMIT008]|uniref:YifB family Mg chelatase-like AAA ATPase n=1 Tax=Jannaschia maritima TaxID=3032585 RepID=UPI002810E935|nr:YifB family Mg chelatase-like AAA ATPase [Jannaschia sp. LMIT008]
MTLARTTTVAFEGLEARPVDVQCAVTPGLPYLGIVGLPDKAVSEAKDRIRTALAELGIALPARRIIVNLSPADLPKEGAHFDLPIALSLLAALDVVPADAVADALSIGGMSLDGALEAVAGALPAAVAAKDLGRLLLCPAACGPEAAWVDPDNVLPAPSLGALIDHLTGRMPLQPAASARLPAPPPRADLREVRGQERAKRALEIAAAGRHHLFLVGPPGSGKSMLAARLPTILPPLTAAESLETSMIHSLAGTLPEGGVLQARPFQEPHHTASVAAIAGGGRRAGPGQISLAHNGVLFMDEFPEFPRPVLETLRQPIETGEVVIARANAHVRYPCRFLLIAAANPCRCGMLFDADAACSRAPGCGEEYLAKISGPLMDRFDLRLEVPAVPVSDLTLPPTGETSERVAARVADAREVQAERYAGMDDVRVNADLSGDRLTDLAAPDAAARDLLDGAVARMKLSARGYHRVLKVARTIADLDSSGDIGRAHVAEALSYRLVVGSAA